MALRSRSATRSSQEEYEDSENESDRMMASSNEDVQHRFLLDEEADHDESPPANPESASSDGASLASEDDDDISTALGVAESAPAFTPQPHAFSQPPSTRLVQAQTTTSHGSYFPSHHANDRASSVPIETTLPTTPPARNSYPRAHVRRRSHTPFNMISPNHTIPVDHDAALRASLSTLLSCAAAARGLPKREGTQPSSSASRANPLLPPRPTTSTRVEQGTLRLIPESAMGGSESGTPPPLPRRPESRTSTSEGSGKRKSKSPARDKRKKQRASMVAASDDQILTLTPTLMTWVMGAGVVVLFSAISFSAGYALGREVGRVEAMSGGGAGCSGEIDGGLTRHLGLRPKSWRWGNASGVRV